MLIIAGVIPLLIAIAVIYFMGIAQRREIIGENFQRLSEKVRENVSMSLTADVRAVRNLAKLPATVHFLKSAKKRPLAKFEKPWSQLTEEDQPLKNILENPLARTLNAFNSIEYTFGEVFATDSLGRVIAATNKTTDYWQADEGWWQQAYNAGEGELYLSEVGFDASAGVYSINICVPVLQEAQRPDTDIDKNASLQRKAAKAEARVTTSTRDGELRKQSVGTRKVIGVIKAVLDITRVFENVVDIDVGKGGKAVLSLDDGIILFAEDTEPLQKQLPKEEIPNVYMGSSGWFLTQLPDGTEELVGFARISFKVSENSFFNMPEDTFYSPWLVIVCQELTYAFAPVRKLIRYTFLSGGALIVVFFFLGIYFAEKKVVSPLKTVTQTAKHVANGDLTKKVRIFPKDEIGEVASSFNQMVSNLRKRTSLDNISLHMFSHLELADVLSMAMETLKSTFNATFARIWLIEDGDLCDECIHAKICSNREQCLHLQVTVGIYAKDEDYVRIPLGELQVGKIAESRQSVLIDNLAEDGLHNLEWHLKKGIVSFAGYPLLSGDELLGVLAIFSRSSISNEEFKILGSFVNRTAMAIQNAKLHSAVKELNLNLERKVEERTQELKEANAKLRKADQLKSEFLANMSHELRTPLNAIIGFAEVLRDGICGELNDDQMMSVIDIHESGKHLLQMINDILDLSKVEAGKMELQLEEFSLPKAIERAQSIVRDMANKKNLDLRQSGLSSSEALPNIYADPVKFKQIMYNLLSNAVKFTPEGGTVTISAALNDDEFLISVEDTGIGIAPEEQEAIFDEFKQLDSSWAREYEGTGLGLALTKKLVRLHEGKIWVESELDEGSKFSFTLPVNEPDMEVAQNILDRLPSKDIQKSDHPDEETILVVEDNPQAAQLLCIYLTEAGYSPVVATDGDKAVKMAQKIKPFAITLDIMLPKKDGWQVMEELKGSEDTRDIPIIIISIVDDQSLGFSMGAAGYLTKPIDKEQLMDILDNAFPRLKSEAMAPDAGAKSENFVPQVLIVDDKVEDLELMESILQSEGFEVLEASSGEEGLTMAVMEHPDLIILDLLMPGMSGFDVVKSLQKHPDARGIPIIICTVKELTAEDRDKLNNKVQSVVQKGEEPKAHLLRAVRKIENL